jgi:hypothetical protein
MKIKAEQMAEVNVVVARPLARPSGDQPNRGQKSIMGSAEGC